MAACAEGRRLRAADRLTKQTKEHLKRLAGKRGLKLPGLTELAKAKEKGALAKKEAKSKFVNAMLVMAGPNSADIEIGAWADWARGHMANNK